MQKYNVTDFNCSFFFDFSSPLLSARKKNDRVSNDVLRNTLCIGEKSYIFGLFQTSFHYLMIFW